MAANADPLQRVTGVGVVGTEATEVSLGTAAPKSVVPGQVFTVHFAAYPYGQDADVFSLLQSQSPDSHALLGKRTCRWASGTEVVVTLAAEGFQVAHPSQAFVWNSRIETLDFTVRESEGAIGRSGVLELTVLVAGYLVAVVCLNIRVNDVADFDQQRATQRAATTAFASYASADRSLVAHIVGAIQRASGMSVFLDCLDLQASEAWKPRLADEIMQRDMFMLFWSRKASASHWVQWEWQTAMRDKGLKAFQLHPLEPDVSPPTALGHLHTGSVHTLIADYYATDWLRHPFRWLSKRLKH